MSREAFDIEAALEKCHAGTAWQRDLIAAALTAADKLDEFKYSDLQRAATTLREMCARAMVQPDMVEVRKDAERYRWLREHFRFANDSMRELWFDPALEPNDSSVPVDLDAEIDRAMSGANAKLTGQGGA